MRVLVVGGTGLIGAALVSRLLAEGHEPVVVSRSVGPGPGHLRIDIGRMKSAGEWTAALREIDAVVNAAGAFQNGPGQSIEGVHVTGISALYEACEQRGIRRVVHLSALGADRETPTDFSRTKHEGELALMSRKLDWIVLRPSVVIGRGAYGGSALLRGVSALPVLLELPDTAPIQPLYLDDLIETILFFLNPTAPARLALDVAGPRRLSFSDTARMFRRWYRWRPARSLRVPSWVAGAMYRLGDAAFALGWINPVTSTARAEMRRGATGDTAAWQNVTGIHPREIETTLMREPAPVQERWFARLYALKPAIFGVFGLFWIATGIISLGPGYESGMSLLREGGMPEGFGVLALVSGALADIVIGCAILYRPLTRYGLWAALVISLVYVAVGTVLVPRLWSEPLGPMLKIWPVLMLNLVAMAIQEDR